MSSWRIADWLYKKPAKPEILTKEDYQADLLDVDPDILKAAYERAWHVRDFEIEMYWKRASYFWALLAAAFAGYFALAGSDRYSNVGEVDVELYYLVCLGWILSVALMLTNVASKTWQKNWEAHIDLLEDRFTGPLYKTVLHQESRSVTNINEIVAVAILFAWGGLGLKFLGDNGLLNTNLRLINWPVAIGTVVTGVITFSMFCGHGRSGFATANHQMYRRVSSAYDDSDRS